MSEYPREATLAAILAEGHAPKVCRVAELTAQDATVLLEKGASLRVSAVSAGVPLEDVTLQLYGAIGASSQGSAGDRGSMPSTPQPFASRSTNRDGSALFAGLPMGEYVLQVRDARYASIPRKATVNQVQSAEAIVISASAAASIGGTIMHRDPSPASIVIVARAADQFPYTAAVGSQGLWEIKGLPSAGYHVEAIRAPTLLDAQRPMTLGAADIEVPDGAHVEVSLNEPQNAVLKGTVLVNGSPRPGVDARFRLARKPGSYSPSASLEWRCITDVAGRYDLRLPSGSKGDFGVWDQQSAQGEVCLALRRAIEVPDGETVNDVNIEAGSLTLQAVAKETGTNIPNEQLMLVPESTDRARTNGVGSWTVRTGLAGTVVLRLVPAGGYSVRPADASDESAIKHIEIAPGQEATLTLNR